MCEVKNFLVMFPIYTLQITLASLSQTVISLKISKRKQFILALQQLDRMKVKKMNAFLDIFVH